MIFWNIIETPVGQITLVEQDGVLVRIYMPNSNRPVEDIEFELIQLDADVYQQDTPLLDLVQSQVEEYFQGERTEFDVPLKIEGTGFQKTVWDQIASIPFGETLSYGEIAHLINKPNAVRAVGNACGNNPIPLIIPCHRVLASNQQLGGYSSGLETKRLLLQHEGITYR